MAIREAPARAAKAEPQADLTRLFSYRISVLSRQLAREGGRRYLAAIGLTLPQWRVLSTLGRFGELGVTPIADHCSMDRGQTSRTLDTMIAAGLIRLQPGIEDRRTTLFSLSAEGERRYAAGLPIALERQSRLLEGFSEKDIATFSVMLDKMLGRLQVQQL